MCDHAHTWDLGRSWRWCQDCGALKSMKPGSDWIPPRTAAQDDDDENA